jgi:V/A-type H+-transporting ATPase subunit I
MILGDIGYGLVSLTAFLILRKKLPTLKPLINILILSSLSTIFFGFLFGEFFGFEVLFGYELPRIMSRLHETIQLLMIAVLMGVIHVNLGFVLGFINEFKTHGLIRAMLEKGSWMVVEIGVVMYYLSAKGYLSVNSMVGTVLILAGVIMLIRGEGIKGVVELPTLLSHTLSYARLMGAGLASVGLAAVINNVVGSLFSKGGVFILLGIVLLLLGHFMNLLLGIMEGFLHSLRLNYVEFFTKFYKGGGIPYVPFGGRKSGGG